MKSSAEIPKMSKLKRHFRKQWLKDFRWLADDENKDLRLVLSVVNCEKEYFDRKLKKIQNKHTD